MKYKEIQNLEDIDKARHSLQRKIRRKEKELGRRTDELRESLTGVNLFGATLRTVSSRTATPYDIALLKLVRRLKRGISKL